MTISGKKAKEYYSIIKKEIIQHSIRVSEYAFRMSIQSGIGDPEVMAYAGAYHDIGKFFIVDIIAKPGLLSEEDREIIKMHPFYSVVVLKSRPMNQEVLDLILTHHAYPDGKGYPVLTRVSEKQMLIQVADIYDALNSERIYRKKPRKNGWENVVLSHKITEDFISLIKDVSNVKDKPIGDVLDRDIQKFLNYTLLTSSSP